MKNPLFKDVFIAMGVSSHLEIEVFEATNDPRVQLHVCEGSSPKRESFHQYFLGKN